MLNKQNTSIQEVKTVPDELQLVGITVPLELRFYNALATFDFKRILPPVVRPNCEPQELSDDLFVPTKKLGFTYQHIPISVAIYYNVAFSTSNSTQLIVNEDAQLLVDSFFDALL